MTSSTLLPRITLWSADNTYTLLPISFSIKDLVNNSSTKALCVNLLSVASCLNSRGCSENNNIRFCKFEDSSLEILYGVISSNKLYARNTLTTLLASFVISVNKPDTSIRSLVSFSLVSFFFFFRI